MILTALARPLRALRRLALTALPAALLLAGPTLATWSIVVVDTRTGEVCIASATCLTLDLQETLPVVQVGRGAAALQSAIDLTGQNRRVVWDAMRVGKSPGQILNILRDGDPDHQQRQYGIVTLDGNPRAFTGQFVGPARRAVRGVEGDLRYAVQGNVLTGGSVIIQARNALLNTPGPLGDRVMAAMEAARALGGDGRCSCSNLMPTSCGAPPRDFEITCETAFLVWARLGDVDGVCTQSAGCANGEYFLNLNEIGRGAGGDPVLRMQEAYATWRLSRAGRVDHVQSKLVAPSTSLVADGRSTLRVEVELADMDGYPVATRAPRLWVEQLEGGPSLVKLGKVEDLGRGRFAVTLRARERIGGANFAVHVADGDDTVRLAKAFPLRLRHPEDPSAGGIR